MTDFWEAFEKSGKIEDYLKYRDINKEEKDFADRESEPIGNP